MRNRSGHRTYPGPDRTAFRSGMGGKNHSFPEPADCSGINKKPAFSGFYNFLITAIFIRRISYVTLLHAFVHAFRYPRAIFFHRHEEYPGPGAPRSTPHMALSRFRSGLPRNNFLHEQRFQRTTLPDPGPDWFPAPWFSWPYDLRKEP